ncbi:MAG: hypothetical protein QXU81_00045 [Candidatus Bathyarchaeia archaeon]
MRENNWDDSLRLGGKGEKIVSSAIEEALPRLILRKLRYWSNRVEQKSGIDMILRLDEARVEVKTRNHKALKYNDIAVETVSVIEENKPGWIFTSRADYIAYVILDRSERRILRGWLLKMPDFRTWFLSNVQKYSKHMTKTRRGSREWHTVFATVPLKDIPRSILYQFYPSRKEECRH